MQQIIVTKYKIFLKLSWQVWKDFVHDGSILGFGKLDRPPTEKQKFLYNIHPQMQNF